MPLAYYAVEAKRAFWEEHWAGRDVAEALRGAEASPLTAAIEAALPARGPVLEAGCGVGQYVVLFRRRGRAMVGVDWSTDALRRTRAVFPATPLATMDLGQLGLRSGAFAAYISLGVVEHDPAGPDRILREARRVLAPGGVLVISVPFVNGVRRLGASWIRRDNEARSRRGASFYQFAFGRAEFESRLRSHGFRVISARPYDPARILRRWLWRPRPDGPAREASGAAGRSGLRALARRALYAHPALLLLGHMILFVAARDEGP